LRKYGNTVIIKGYEYAYRERLNIAKFVFKSSICYKLNYK